MRMLFSVAKNAFQSAPSLRRATLQPRRRRACVGISIRALLAEGDTTTVKTGGDLRTFQSAPSLRRATAKLNNSTACHMFKIAIFI